MPPASRAGAWEPGETWIWCPEAWERGGSACREWNVASGGGGSPRKTSPADRWEGWRGRKSEGALRIWGTGPSPKQLWVREGQLLGSRGACGRLQNEPTAELQKTQQGSGGGNWSSRYHPACLLQNGNARLRQKQLPHGQTMYSSRVTTHTKLPLPTLQKPWILGPKIK